MMKKLFMWSALLMTGFAFYSCDDVVDNPVKDTNAEWNYSVSVTCPGFDFKGWADPVTSEAFTYEVPKTLYVLNEEGQEIGTISTPTAPAINTPATYSGTLKGALGGQKLIIATKVGSDLAKQDGTAKSAVENGIYQADTVVIKMYNAGSKNVTTAAAKLKNSTAIIYTASGSIKAEDKVMVTANNQSFEWTVFKKFDPSDNAALYLAIPTNGDPEEKITISNNGLDGFTRGATITKENYTLTPGEYKDWVGWIPFENIGVDLTVWDAKWREKNTGWHNLWQYVQDKKSFIITQSGKETLDSVSVGVYGDQDKNIAVTLNNVRLGKGRFFQIYNGAKVALTLVGENKFETLNLNTPFTKNGDGTWKFEQLNLGGSTNGYDADGKLIVNYAAEYTIEEDMNLKYLTVNNGAKLTITDGKKVTVNSAAADNRWTAVEVQNGTLNIGKGATLDATNGAKDQYVFRTTNSKINIGENAIVNAQGGKNGTAMQIDANSGFNYELNIGKNASVTLIGGPEDVLGRGINLNCNNSAIVDINIAEGATLKAVGIDGYGLNCNTDEWNDGVKQATTNFNIAKNGKFICEDTEAGVGFDSDVDYGIVNFTGEGLFEAKSKAGIALRLNRWTQDTRPSAFNFKGGSFSAISGGNNPGVYCNRPFTIDEKITSFKAQKGADATLYISWGGTEAKLEDLVADKTKFNDPEPANGVRTITPKPAE